MRIIGAVINTSVPGIDEMIESRNKAKLLELARMQIYYGCDMLAINCGTRLESEPEDIEWMFRTIQDELELPLCIDSPNPDAHAAGLKVHRHGRALVDAITGERDRIENILPLVQKYDARVVAILHDEEGMPTDVEGRLRVIPKIVEAMNEFGVDLKDLYVDCMVFPLAVDQNNGRIYLDTLKAVQEMYPRINTICGLNNISYGLPQEDLVNQAFAVQCFSSGQDAIFIEITKESAATIRAVAALLGRDDYCIDYIKSYRRSDLNIFASPEDGSR